MEQIRAFVAIELPGSVRSELERIQGSLKGKGVADHVRWVKPEGIHLTLKFLGNVPAGTITEIVRVVTQGSEGIRPFTIRFAGLGCFPSSSRPSVIWVGVEGDTGTLMRLQTAVEDSLSVLGHPAEERMYTPHLTLGRVARDVAASERRRLGDMIAEHIVGSLGEMQVCDVCLIRSELSPSGARYTRLAAVTLE
ncbi:MAG: RNA 2',3'-cyclic phosphodiesterase [Anaerolineae bacterium]|nr:RNA 2',3'-cyclic phosphodiesterase [Anaerolineae bacterium]